MQMHFQVSEGVDFADSRGRAVVITGIPYAPYKDPKVHPIIFIIYFSFSVYWAGIYTKALQ